MRIGGRGTGPRLAKQTAAPKQTFPVQSPAVAQPWASENAAPAPQTPLLLPRKELYGLVGEGPGTLRKAQEQLGPPRNPSPAVAGSAKTKTLPAGRPRGLPDPRMLPEPSARQRRRLLSTLGEAMAKRERRPEVGEAGVDVCVGN